MELITLIGNWIIQNAELLAGIPLVIVIDFVNRKVNVDNDSQKFFRTVATSLGAAFLLTYDQLKFGNVNEFVNFLAIIFTETQLVFKWFYQDLSIRDAFLALIRSKSASSALPAVQEAPAPVEPVPVVPVAPTEQPQG